MHSKLWGFFLVFLLLISTLSAAFALEVFPRFAKLKPHETNLRVGPGKMYKILSIYENCSKVPIELLAKYDVWYKVRDWQGGIGWIHTSKISEGHRTVLVKSGRHTLYKDRTHPIAYIEEGVIAKLLECLATEEQRWCFIHVQTASYNLKGWIAAEALSGINDQDFGEKI